jgi:hypothetical protein
VRDRENRREEKDDECVNLYKKWYKIEGEE